MCFLDDGKCPVWKVHELYVVVQFFAIYIFYCLLLYTVCLYLLSLYDYETVATMYLVK